MNHCMHVADYYWRKTYDLDPDCFLFELFMRRCLAAEAAAGG